MFSIKGSETLEQKEIQESNLGEYSCIGLVDQSESESRWVELHQMFDEFDGNEPSLYIS